MAPLYTPLQERLSLSEAAGITVCHRAEINRHSNADVEGGELSSFLLMSWTTEEGRQSVMCWREVTGHAAERSAVVVVPSNGREQAREGVCQREVPEESRQN